MFGGALALCTAVWGDMPVADGAAFVVFMAIVGGLATQGIGRG
jgi:hypothetical protein